MKKAVFITIAATTLLIAGRAEVKAQRYEKDNKYWEHRREADKKRDEYYRERDKKRAEYARERRKKQEEYYRESSKRHKEYLKARHKHGLPGWARAHRYEARYHAYFRDYSTFYDPYRGGYVFLDGGNWRFSAEIPSFMINVDLGRANILIVKDVPISRHPEDFYHDYDEDYWND
ncbi:hypothetical protein EDD80_11655 [Anseongella ginsenosidimutans]|uniref:Uncharacterized protein n=1 Tax=Anseongella ginsenosidimutans TaxID=496056 RepID=A0A4R3KLK2_9SPHI|nr:hypothetical protein [Anseongella ginsenosidimutans]QEC53817.1 hypothetical protein FRZ59_16745 [Anseongella ginsenosidimutans]TCS84963.1 hypothetical protein EDD80_11655 [Anseongella ginsenosidimutans]